MTYQIISRKLVRSRRASQSQFLWTKMPLDLDEDGGAVDEQWVTDSRQGDQLEGALAGVR